MKLVILFAFVMLFSTRCFGQGKEFYRITVLSELDYVIRNPEGKQSGYNPFLQRKFKQINESYGVFNVDSEDSEIDPPPPVNEFVDDDPKSGEYLLTLFGQRRGRYELYISLSRTTRDGDRIDLIGVIDSGQTVQYQFTYDRTPGQPYVVQKVVDARSLRQDLDNCYNLKLLGGRPLYVDLDNRVRKYEEWIQKNDTAKARQELEKLDKKLDEVYEKTKGKSKDPNHFISDDAYRILKEDIKGLSESEGVGGR